MITKAKRYCQVNCNWEVSITLAADFLYFYFQPHSALKFWILLLSVATLFSEVLLPVIHEDVTLMHLVF